LFNLSVHATSLKQSEYSCLSRYEIRQNSHYVFVANVANVHNIHFHTAYTSLFTKVGSNTTKKLQTQYYERKKGKKLLD